MSFIFSEIEPHNPQSVNVERKQGKIPQHNLVILLTLIDSSVTQTYITRRKSKY